VIRCFRWLRSVQ